MANWTNTELEVIGNANLMVLETTNMDGAPRKPLVVWAVRVGDHIYVRSIRGQDSDWYRAVQAQPEGHMQSGGIRRRVRFETVSAPPNDVIDAAYRAKFGRGSPVGSITSSTARNATIRLVPCSEQQKIENQNDRDCRLAA